MSTKKVLLVGIPEDCQMRLKVKLGIDRVEAVDLFHNGNDPFLRTLSRDSTKVDIVGFLHPFDRLRNSHGYDSLTKFLNALRAQGHSPTILPIMTKCDRIAPPGAKLVRDNDTSTCSKDETEKYETTKRILNEFYQIVAENVEEHWKDAKMAEPLAISVEPEWHISEMKKMLQNPNMRTKSVQEICGNYAQTSSTELPIEPGSTTNPDQISRTPSQQLRNILQKIEGDEEIPSANKESVKKLINDEIHRLDEEVRNQAPAIEQARNVQTEQIVETIANDLIKKVSAIGLFTLDSHAELVRIIAHLGGKQPSEIEDFIEEMGLEYGEDTLCETTLNKSTDRKANNQTIITALGEAAIYRYIREESEKKVKKKFKTKWSSLATTIDKKYSRQQQKLHEEFRNKAEQAETARREITEKLRKAENEIEQMKRITELAVRQAEEKQLKSENERKSLETMKNSAEAERKEACTARDEAERKLAVAMNKFAKSKISGTGTRRYLDKFWEIGLPIIIGLLLAAAVVTLVVYKSTDKITVETFVWLELVFLVSVNIGEICRSLLWICIYRSHRPGPHVSYQDKSVGT